MYHQPGYESRKFALHHHAGIVLSNEVSTGGKEKKKGSNAKLVFAGTWSRKQFRSLFKIGVGSCLTKAGERSTAWDSLYFHHLPSPPFEAET